jgi:hypothetical protein
MAYAEDHDPEMAKWAHQGLDATRRRAAEEQRHALADLTNRPATQPNNSSPWIATRITLVRSVCDRQVFDAAHHGCVGELGFSSEVEIGHHFGQYSQRHLGFHA